MSKNQFYREKKRVNPKTMVIFSYPKIGKTSLMLELDDYLLVDFEEGGDMYDGNIFSIENVEDFSKLKKILEEGDTHFKYIILDTITSMYLNIINAIAVNQYNNDEGLDHPLDFDITTLAYGAGHGYKRNAVQKVIKFFSKYCDTLIILGHVADKNLTFENATHSTVQELDLEGKLKNIIALKVDALGLLYRSGKDENSISFNTNAGIIGGTRSPHLTGKTIVISERNEDGSLETHWDKVFV